MTDLRETLCSKLEVLSPALGFEPRPDRSSYRGNRCDGYAVRPDQLTLSPDARITPPPLEAGQPPLFGLANTPFTLSCDAFEVGDGQGGTIFPYTGAAGSDVTVPSATFTLIFDWRSIPDITTDRLNYLSNKEDRETQILGWLEAEEAGILDLVKSAYKLKTGQAQYLLDQLDQLLDQLSNLTLLTAQTQIDCYWWNEQQTADCPTDPDTGAAALSPGNTHTVAAQSFRTNLTSLDAPTWGVAAANALALSFAESQLDCRWGSEEQTVACHTDLGFPTLVPGELPADPPDGPTAFGQIGTVVLPANSVESYVGVLAANEQAEAEALAQLNCFYVSDEVVTDCEVYGAGTVEDPHPYPTDGTGPTADPEAGTPGYYVTLPQGFVRSEASQAQADNQAQLEALSLLDCYWINPEISAACPDVDVGGETFEADTELSSPVSAVVPADTFRSYAPGGSYAEALDQATLFAEGQLFCIYCNKQVLATCAVPYDGTYSLDRTRTVPAGSICGADPELAQLQAEVQANIPVRESEGGAVPCSYGNDPVVMTCTSLNGPHPGASELSVESQAQVVTIAANTVIVAEGDEGAYANPLEAANAQAELIAESLLDCYWVNDEVRGGSCDDGTSITTNFSGVVTVTDADESTGGAFNKVVTVANAGGSELLFVRNGWDIQVSTGMNVTAGTEVASAKANTICVDLGNSDGDGGGGSGGGTGSGSYDICAGAGIERSPGTPAGIYRSRVSKADANSKAQLHAAATTTCQSEVRECGHPFEMRARNLDRTLSKSKWFTAFVTPLAREVEICPGYVLDPEKNLVMDIGTSGHKTLVSSSTGWTNFYVKVELLPAFKKGVPGWTVTSAILVETESQDPPDAPNMTLPLGYPGRAWYWIGSVRVSAEVIVEKIQNLTANIIIR